MTENTFLKSSGVYDIDPCRLREHGVELIKRDRDNAYRSHGQYKNAAPDVRAAKYDELKNKIASEGFNREFPIEIEIQRKDGRDKILQGHHRLAMAIELGLPTVPVRFVCRRR